ncbi:hypothetical protein DERP_003479 [Dermatophagoides pteronyssinus]|uniref:Transmembrane protein n=1 Tax=Dermatophagoides pteronyssinus TaxID=6956 RepID=A0ABQ8JKR2_DERPT|nr:hypothetical protein DERP_003479 [Dermatophagoides pteronyssinus]
MATFHHHFIRIERFHFIPTLLLIVLIFHQLIHKNFCQILSINYNQINHGNANNNLPLRQSRQFESILSLFQQMNQSKQKQNKKHNGKSNFTNIRLRTL